MFLKTFAAIAALVALPAFAETAMVLNSRDATISLLDMQGGQETGRFDSGKEPHHLYPTPDGKSLIVANATSNDLLFLDPRTGAVQRRVRGIDDPYQIGFTPDQKRFVTAALRLDRVDVYDYVNGDFKLAKRIPMKSMPSHLAFSADSRVAFVTLQGARRIAAIDLVTLEPMWELEVGPDPAGLYLTPDGKYLLVGVMGADYVAVVDVAQRKVSKKIRTGLGAHNFRALGDKRTVFVSNRAANTVTPINIATLEAGASFAVPGGPDCMEITPDGKQMWATSRFIKQVSVVDLAQQKVVRTIPVGRSPHGIFFMDRAGLQ